jgi:hypothetical protein
MVFFFGHGAPPAQVDYSSALGKPATHIHEVVTGATLEPSGSRFRRRAEIPAQAACVYPIDF